MTIAKPKRDVPRIPFNEALKRLWASPPQHHKAPKPKRKAKRK